MNNNIEPYSRTTYDLKGGLILSVITGSGTYSRIDSNENLCQVEMVIMEKDGDLRYDMTGGDVVGYFPKRRVSSFVEWFNTNCESPGFFQNKDGSNRNLPLHFLLEYVSPENNPTPPMYVIPAKDFHGSMQHRLY